MIIPLDIMKWTLALHQPQALLLHLHFVNTQVIVGDESHVYHYEAGGMSVLGGVAFNVQPNLPNGEIPFERLDKAVRQVFIRSTLLELS